MVGICVCEAAHLDCESRVDGPFGLFTDPLIKPLTYVSIAALSTCIFSTGYFFGIARKKIG
jgi:hypothetical protein